MNLSFDTLQINKNKGPCTTCLSYLSMYTSSLTSRYQILKVLNFSEICFLYLLSKLDGSSRIIGWKCCHEKIEYPDGCRHFVTRKGTFRTWPWPDSCSCKGILPMRIFGFIVNFVNTANFLKQKTVRFKRGERYQRDKQIR